MTTNTIYHNHSYGRQHESSIESSKSKESQKDPIYMEKPVEPSIVKQPLTWWTNRASRTGTFICYGIQVFIEFSRGDQEIWQPQEGATGGIITNEK